MYLAGRSVGHKNTLDWDAEYPCQPKGCLEGRTLTVLDRGNRPDSEVRLGAQPTLAPVTGLAELPDAVRALLFHTHGVIPLPYKFVNTLAVQLLAMAGRRPADADEVLARLREERERRKATDEPYGTLKEIAAALDVSFGLVGQWEADPRKAGHKKPPEVRRWVKLMGLPPEWADLYDVYRTADRMVEEIQAGQLRGKFSEADRKVTWENIVRNLLGGLRR